MVILQTPIELFEDVVDKAPKIDLLRLKMELVRRFDAQNPLHVVGVATLGVVFQLSRAVRSTFSVEFRNQLGIKLCIVKGYFGVGSTFSAS